MIKLQLVIACGVLLAKFGVITPPVAKGVNQMTFVLFVPCLLFNKVSSSVSLESLESLFIVAIFGFINIIFGFILGFAGWHLVYFVKQYMEEKDRRMNKSNMIEMIDFEDEEDQVIINTDLDFDLANEAEEIQREQIIELENSAKNLNLDDLSTTNNETENSNDGMSDEERNNAAKIKSGRQRVVAAVAFGNATSLPLGLMTGIYPAAKYKTELDLAMSYVGIYLAISQVLMYSVGYLFLSQGKKNKKTNK